MFIDPVPILFVYLFCFSYFSEGFRFSIKSTDFAQGMASRICLKYAQSLIQPSSVPQFLGICIRSRMLCRLLAVCTQSLEICVHSRLRFRLFSLTVLVAKESVFTSSMTQFRCCCWVFCRMVLMARLIPFHKHKLRIVDATTNLGRIIPGRLLCSRIRFQCCWCGAGFLSCFPEGFRFNTENTNFAQRMASRVCLRYTHMLIPPISVTSSLETFIIVFKRPGSDLFSRRV